MKNIREIDLKNIKLLIVVILIVQVGSIVTAGYSESGLEVLNRTTHADDLRNMTSNETFFRLFAFPVNMLNSSGSYEPYENVTLISETDYNMTLSWNNKSVVFKFYTKNESGFKEYLIDKSQEDSDELNLITTIYTNRGSFHYVHNMTTNLSAQPHIFGYEFITENVSCIKQNYSLICDEQNIIFDEAVYRQNLNVNLTSSYVDISGDDLSYIDPVTRRVYSDDPGGGTDEIEEFCANYGDDHYEFEDDTLRAIGADDFPSGTDGRNTRGWMTFDLDNLPNNVLTVLDVDLIIDITDIDEDNCPDVNIEFRKVDGENYDMTPNQEAEEEELFNALDDGTRYSYIYDLDEGEEGIYERDLGSAAVTEVQQNLDGFPDDDFIVSVTSTDEECPDEECNVDIADILDANPPYVEITYVEEDIYPPTTTATATSPPGGPSYTFGTTANYDVEVTLECSDDTGSDPTGCDFTKYCKDTENTCTPTTTYSSPFTVSTDGTSYIRYFSVDNANNQESTRSKTIIINRNYPRNVEVYVNDNTVFEHTGDFDETGTTNDFSQELIGVLSNCVADSEGYCDIPITVHSDEAGNINITNIQVYFDIEEYIWNVSDLAESSNYKVRIRSTDGHFNTSWDESDSDFTIGSDTLSPEISFVEPTPQNGSQQSERNITLNLTTLDNSNNHYTLLDFNSDLRLWMRMDDVNASGDLVDLSSYGTNSTAQGDASQTEDGKFGKAFEFDGTGDYIRLPDTHPLNPYSTDFSISFWLKKNEDRFGGLVVKGPNEANGYWIRTMTSGTVQFLISNETQFNAALVYSNTILDNGIWYHVVAVKNESGISMHLNGVEENFTSYTGGVNASDDYVAIGGGYAQAGYFNGSIDEVTFFNRALSEREIGALYNSEVTQYERSFTDLGVGDYDFRGHTVDESANMNSTEERTVLIDSIDLTELAVIYANDTERIFRFVINNTLDFLVPNISWSFDTGESIIDSEYNTSLESGEDVFVFAYHNYTNPGNYTVIASADNGVYYDSEEIQIEVL